jgi:hypothetical protein
MPSSLEAGVLQRDAPVLLPCLSVGGSRCHGQPPGQPTSVHPPRPKCSTAGSRAASPYVLLLERPRSAVCCAVFERLEVQGAAARGVPRVRVQLAV